MSGKLTAQALLLLVMFAAVSNARAANHWETEIIGISLLVAAMSLVGFAVVGFFI